MPRYYFSVRYLSSNADMRLLSGRCITALHYYLINNKPYDIGVSFPLWTDKTLGREIDFVCEGLDKLQKLRNCDYFSMMIREGLFAVSDVDVVNEKGIVEVRFVRNQGIKKIFPGEMRRRLTRARKRAETRGEAFAPSKLASPKEFGVFHSSFLGSSSTGQSFMLHIQREIDRSCQREGVGSRIFNSYGLATMQSHRGSVPQRLNQQE
ncbi:CRISPR-associated endonuclease Csy4 [Modicisalibacter muralis]|uniref:CRISPR-associated endonuclease Csy4 n=1 Tax=Modicisalibacter muralis TaxID=119000 RepID=A0A1G9LIR4_9GAMM|nr:type I-F CRISPR-associated endoribonuclease Cas6/Csy4 [Halomonas muralis]SDL61425.1 CRISPR-associated endonuclease Csy4 [Halomonas muralis]